MKVPALSTMQNLYANKIMLLIVVSLGLTGPVFAENYDAFAAQGYRWVTVDGPFACKTEEDVERITAHRTDAAELEVVENIECYYLIPGTIVQIIKEDRARRMSEIRLRSIIRPLWTYTTFLSKHPVRDTYGVIETPENSGLVPTADTGIAPQAPSATNN